MIVTKPYRVRQDKEKQDEVDKKKVTKEEVIKGENNFFKFIGGLTL